MTISYFANSYDNSNPHDNLADKLWKSRRRGWQDKAIRHLADNLFTYYDNLADKLLTSMTI